MHLKTPALLACCLFFCVQGLAQNTAKEPVLSGNLSTAKASRMAAPKTNFPTHSVTLSFFHPEDGTLISYSHTRVYPAYVRTILPPKSLEPVFCLQTDKAARQVFVSLERKARQARARQQKLKRKTHKTLPQTTGQKRDLPGPEGRLMNTHKTASWLWKHGKKIFRRQKSQSTPSQDVLNRLSAPGKLQAL